MNWVEIISAAGAGLALIGALVRIIMLTSQVGDLRVNLGLAKSDLALAKQASADAGDRVSRLQVVADNRQKVISGLLESLRKAGKPGAAGSALDELLAPKATSPTDPKAHDTMPAEASTGTSPNPAGPT